MTIAEYCKKIREETGKNILAFSEQLHCSHSYIMKVESGQYNKPTPLIFAKIVLKYGLDLDKFISAIDLNISSTYLEQVKRHLDKNIGTKPVRNRKNIVMKFYNEILAPMGYTDVDKKIMTGNVIVSQSKYNPFTIMGDKYTSIDDSILEEKATIFPAVDYVCIKNKRLCFACVIGVKSTIVVDVDKEIIDNYISKMMDDISLGYFDVPGKSLAYDIVLLTPSEKVFNYISKESKIRSRKLPTDYRIDIALVRPKRPIQVPNDFILK